MNKSADDCGSSFDEKSLDNDFLRGGLGGGLLLIYPFDRLELSYLALVPLKKSGRNHTWSAAEGSKSQKQKNQLARFWLASAMDSADSLVKKQEALKC